MKRLSVSLIIIVLVLVFPDVAFSQSALGELEQAANRSASSVYVPAASAPSRVGSAASTVKSGILPSSSSSSSISSVVAGALMQNLLNNLLTTPERSPEEIEAERLEQERIEAEAELKRQEEAARQQELHDNLINSSKSLSGSESLDFKSLDGDMETMRKEASDQFEPDRTTSTLNTVPNGNNFFGIPLSEVDFNTAIELEANPVYNDVKNAVDLSDKYLENDKLENTEHEKEQLVVDIIGGAVVQAKGEPVIEKPDCNALNDKLSRYKSDMIRFNEWNTSTLTELKKWEDQNNEAFWNAVKDGAGAAFGVFLDYLNETRSSASKIKKILEDNEGKYISENIFTADQISQYKKLLDQRITLCNITNLAKESMKPWDYVNLARNLLQGTTERLAESDGDCITMINVLRGQGYLSDTPWVDTAQFLTGEVINKFMDDPSVVIKPNSLIKGSLKIPYVTIAQLVVDEAYNVTDMLTSFNNICTLRDADGKASDAVRKIQNNMDNIKIQLKNCPVSN